MRSRVCVTAFLQRAALLGSRPSRQGDEVIRAVASSAEDVRSEVLALRALGACLRATGDEGGAVATLSRALEVARSTGQRSEVAATERALAGTHP